MAIFSSVPSRVPCDWAAPAKQGLVRLRSTFSIPAPVHSNRLACQSTIAGLRKRLSGAFSQAGSLAGSYDQTRGILSRINGLRRISRFRCRTSNSASCARPQLVQRTLRRTARYFRNAVSDEVLAIERRPGGATWADLRDHALIARMVAEARMFASSPSATAVAQPHAGTPPTS